MSRRIRLSGRQLVAVVLVAVALVAHAGGLTLQVAAGASSDVQPSANQLAGTWEVTVNRPAPLPSVRSLQVITDDGGIVETSNESPASRTAQYGSWERVEGRLYAVTGVHFRFNPQTGAYLGTYRINSMRRLSEDGQSFMAVARVTILDPDDNVIGSFNATASGTRMRVERIPDQP
jgi:hypothetical protein